MRKNEVLKASHISLKKNPSKFFKVVRFNKKTVTINNPKRNLKNSNKRIYYRDVAKIKIKNPSSDIKKAEKLYQDFNRFLPSRIGDLDLPIDKNTVLIKLGKVEDLEYVSNKKIMKSDTRKKTHVYIHNFTEHGKNPYLLTNQEGNILIIYDPVNKIEVKKEGII